MKTIFNEKQTAGIYQHESVVTMHRKYDFDGLYTNIPLSQPKVERQEYTISTFIDAKWDKKTGVLCIDLSIGPGCDYDWDWLPSSVRILETYSRKTDAIRRAIGAADGWRWQISAIIPQPKADDEVLRIWRQTKMDSQQEAIDQEYIEV